jgi:hypothetical protein
MAVPSPSFGDVASAAFTAAWSVVNRWATEGFELKNTTDRGCPGFRAANTRAAAIAEEIFDFMLFDESISSTVPIPFADAEENTLTFCTGLPFSVTFTSADVSGCLRGASSVSTYARSGNSVVPASTT